jgi:hypothetical protein
MDDNDWAELAELADPAELDRVRAELGEAATHFEGLWTGLRNARADPKLAERYSEAMLALLRRTLPNRQTSGRTRLSSADVADDSLRAHVLDLLFGPAETAPISPSDSPDPSHKSLTRRSESDSSLGPSPSGRARVAALQERAKIWLLSMPGRDLAEIAAHADPWGDDLIRLHAPDGSVRLPSFQFDEHDAPIPVVQKINTMFRSDRDPWGAACWWLGSSLWFPKAPAAMIGEVPDERLVSAARTALDGSR